MIDFHSVANNHLKGFSKAFLSLTRQNNYDVIIAPANSGSAMIVFAEITAQAADINFPRTLILPVFRTDLPRPDFANNPLRPNNDSLIPKIQANPSLNAQYSRLLYIDDEIGDGSSFYTCINLLKRAGRISEQASCTILAEGNGVAWEYSFPDMATDFLPYAIKPNHQWYSLIFNLMPDEILEELQNKIDYRITPKEATCLLFSLPLKDLVETEPYLNYELLELAEKKIPSFAEMQSRWLELCARVISQAIQEQRIKEVHKRETNFSLGKLLPGF